MTSLPKINHKLSQLYPGAGKYRLNTCLNPDCSNFGRPFSEASERRRDLAERRPDLPPEKVRFYEQHGPGAYKLSGADRAYRRVSRAFEYEHDPHQWSDHRTMRCLGITSTGRVCDSGFSMLSPDHLAEEVDRLRSFNGVLDGPSCGACGARFLEKPDEFILNGTNERAEQRTAAPKAIRLIHRPCRGRKGARFTGETRESW